MIRWYIRFAELNSWDSVKSMKVRFHLGKILLFYYIWVFSKLIEFSDKNIYKSIIQTCNSLCKRPGCYHNTHVILACFIRFFKFAEFT